MKNSFKEGFLMNYHLIKYIFSNIHLFIFVFIMCLLSSFKSDLYSLPIFLDFIKTFLPFLLISLLVNSDKNNNSNYKNIKNFFSPLIKIRMYILFLILTIFLLFGLSMSLKTIPEFVDIGKYTVEKFQERASLNPEIIENNEYAGETLINIMETDEVFQEKAAIVDNISYKKIYAFIGIFSSFLLLIGIISSLALPIIFNTDTGVFKSIWLSLKYNIKYYKTIISFGLPYFLIACLLGYLLFFQKIYSISFVFSFYVTITYIYYSSFLYDRISKKINNPV